MSQQRCWESNPSFEKAAVYWAAKVKLGRPSKAGEAWTALTTNIK